MKREQIELEFIFRASPAIIYNFLTEPSRIVLWFCDEVEIDDLQYEFFWNGFGEIANLIEDIEEERLKFQWEEAENEDEYLEFRMYKSDVTNETVLEITDFCDEDEVTEQRAYWNDLVEKLKRSTGG